MIHFTRATAADWAPRGVTVNAICPGVFHDRSRISAGRPSTPSCFEMYKEQIPLGDFGQAGGPRPLGRLSGQRRLALHDRRRDYHRRRLHALVDAAGEPLAADGHERSQGRVACLQWARPRRGLRPAARVFTPLIGPPRSVIHEFPPPRRIACCTFAHVRPLRVRHSSGH